MTKSFDLDDAIRAELAGGEPNPHVISDRVAKMIPPAQRDAILKALLPERVGLLIRVQRSAHLSEELAAGHESGDTQVIPAGGKPPVSRWTRRMSGWDLHRAAMDGHDRYPTPAGWKLYADLTVTDCEDLAARYDRRADQNRAVADRFRELMAWMRAASVDRAGDIPEPVEAAA